MAHASGRASFWEGTDASSIFIHSLYGLSLSVLIHYLVKNTKLANQSAFIKEETGKQNRLENKKPLKHTNTHVYLKTGKV